MKLIIFAYPLHYHICQLSLRHALNTLGDISDVVIIWDDLNRPKLEHSFNLSQQLAQQTSAQVIKTSEIKLVKNQRNGWIRQQLVKLHLHKLFNDDAWILLDGDTVIRNRRNLYRTIHNNPYDYYAPAHEFMAHALGLARGAGPSYMTPVWLAERPVLEALHNHVQDRHNSEFIALYDQFVQEHYAQAIWPPLNEIELYANFAVQQLNYQYNLIDNTALTVGADEFLSAWSGTQDIILSGRDRMPESFWAEQMITFNHELNNWLNYHG